MRRKGLAWGKVIKSLTLARLQRFCFAEISKAQTWVKQGTKWTHREGICLCTNRVTQKFWGDSPYHSGFMSSWTTLTNPVHRSWKHSRFSFLVFCNTAVVSETRKLKTSNWACGWILLNRFWYFTEIGDAFSQREGSALGGVAATPHNDSHRAFAGSCPSGAGQFPGAASAVLATPISNRSLVSQLAEGAAQDSYSLTHRSAELVLSTLISCQADRQVSTLPPPPRLKRDLPRGDHAAAQLPSQLRSGWLCRGASFQPRAPPCHCLIRAASSPNAPSAHVPERKKPSSPHAQLLQHSLEITRCKKRNSETPACVVTGWHTICALPFWLPGFLFCSCLHGQFSL